MATVTSADRVLAWNIRLLECPPSNERVAGTFQPSPPFLTWGDLFNDIRLCFDLDYLETPLVGALALWFRGGAKDPAISRPDGNSAPCIYFDHSTSVSYNSGDVLAQYINVRTGAGTGTSGGDDEEDMEVLDPPPLDLTLVAHDPECCSVTDDKLAGHLSNGCATPIRLARNAKFRYLPIPSPAANFSAVVTAPQTPKTSSRGSPTKRPRIDSSNTRSGSSSPTKRDSTWRLKYTVPPELELNVKKLYNGTCVITRNNTSWGRNGGTSMISGPGIETCHIVPKSMFKWYPFPDKEDPTDQELWNAVNSTGNCIVMDSLAHSIFDNRLLAVHPTSHRIRLFAPVRPLLDRNHKKAYFRHDPPSVISLQWHYRMSVFENMCALILEKEGGAKRMPWREGPVFILGGTEESTFEETQGANRGRAVAESHANDDPAGTLHHSLDEGADELCPSMTFGGSSGSTTSSSAMASSTGPLASLSAGMKRKLEFLTSGLGSQGDSYVDNKSTEEFSRNLYYRLGEEVAHQNDVLAFARWIASRQALRTFI